ncbi:hypothetical protein AV654_17615 [Paenibacillus elgii]|uniref:Uncharacterized protein n=1 Tax=Paenibacillus elgii TaxID=189691 RepID=A0A161S415_9BACL|nr:hypothetical protein [Paenibacillus elgii]KZE79289.1 hypothetical protein AV654_17615 [Paenibacillus elgii]
MQNVKFVKVFEGYKVVVHELSDTHFDVRFLFTDERYPGSISFYESDKSDEAIDKANAFLDIYDLALSYNFHVTSQGMQHQNGDVISFNEMFVMSKDEIKNLFEEKYKN